MSNKKNDSKIKKSIIPVPILVRKELLDKKKDSLIGDLQGLEQQIMQIQNVMQQKRDELIGVDGGIKTLQEMIDEQNNAKLPEAGEEKEGAK